MKIAKTVIYNFKCFKEKFELPLTDGLNIVVGDNEAGKSTIIEAIHLALSGWFNGRHISNELTEYLFNRESVLEYLKSIGNGTPIDLPSICIEIYIDSEKNPLLEGNQNMSGADSVGFSFKIEFDPRYQEEYNLLVSSGNIKSLPIEYYHYYWESFARDEHITPRTIPLKSALVDSSANRQQNGSDLYISRIVKESLEPAEIVGLSQAHRKMRDSFMLEEAVIKVNEKIQSAAKVSTKKVELSVDLATKKAWESSLTTYLDDIPFHHIGKGEQCIIKTNLALSHKKTKEANVILVEEPENHLSHSKLNGLIKLLGQGAVDKQIIISTHSSFVANKLGLTNLILLNNQTITRLTDLSKETFSFFERLAGYDTLRLLLCKKAILVEGDSDELIVQRAYADTHDGRLPIEDEIDVISVGTAFLRFLELSEKLKIQTAVVTDTDWSIETLEKKYENYLGEHVKDFIQISFDPSMDTGDLRLSDGRKFNYNTLEPKLLKTNSLQVLNEIFETNHQTEDQMHIYMKNHKTECSIAIFQSDKCLNYPNYITKVIS